MECVELKPGATLLEVDINDELRKIEEVNKQAVVERYRLNPDGTKEFIGTMPAFPEGWDKKKVKAGGDSMVKVRTDREAKLKEAKALLAQGEKLSHVAKALGIPVGTLGSWLKKESKDQEQDVGQKSLQECVKATVDEKVDELKSPVWTEEHKQRARELRDAGLTQREIAEQMGLTYHQVKSFFRREQVKERKIKAAINLDQFKARWIRDVMLEDIDPKVQLQIVRVIQGLEI